MVLHICTMTPSTRLAFTGGNRGRRKVSKAGHVLFATLVILIVELPHSVYPVPLPSSSAWSLPTLNYLFKDTKTRSQSTHYHRENEQGISSQQQNDLQSNLPSSHKKTTLLESSDGKGVSTTGRLISAHDIRMTDNWGWVRRGASDPQMTAETKRKPTRNNIRHSKSKHKQRHSPSSSSTSSHLNGGGRGKKEKMENLLCPFDEIRGPDGKCRKAPRFSLYRVGRK